MPSADPGLFAKACQHALRIEVLLGDSSRGFAVLGVTVRDVGGSCDGLLERPERDEAVTDGQGVAEARVLYERRTARGQIACGAVAEPAAPGLHVDPLRDGELGPRSLHIGAKGIGVASRRPWVDYPPAVIAECVQIRGVGRVYVKRDLEALIRAHRKVDELAELVD